jgi:hypothetical protein
MGFSSMCGEYNSYPFKDNGSFALWYSLEYDDINKTLILILNLSNYYIKSSPTIWDNITSKPI